MKKILNIVSSKEIINKLIVFFSLGNTELIFLRNLEPMILAVLAPKYDQKFYSNLYSFIFQNLQNYNFSFFYSYITEEDYEKIVLNCTEDIEVGDFIITPRLGQYSKIPIYIRSFNFAEGTGAHTTTKMILSKIKKIKQINSNTILVIDYGSGSGILSIAAKKILPQATVLSLEINFKYLKESINNYNLNDLQIHSALTDSPNLLKLSKIKQKFEKIILIANVPIQVLQMLFHYLKETSFFVDYLLISGIKKTRNQSKEDFLQNINNQYFSKYLDNYNLNINICQDWILLEGEIK